MGLVCGTMTAENPAWGIGSLISHDQSEFLQWKTWQAAAFQPDGGKNELSGTLSSTIGWLLHKPPAVI